MVKHRRALSVTAAGAWPAGLLGLLLAGALLVFGLARPTADSRLFLDEQPLDMDLLVELRDLCRRASQEGCEDVPATLVYREPGGAERRLEIRVKSRGRWRLNRGNCSVPPMFLAFPGDSADGTLFEGQDLLPLTTHCRSNQRRFEGYVIKEYLAYRIYNLLTPKSARARLVRISYFRPDGRKHLSPHYAFLTEHFDAMAARNGAQRWEPEELDPELVDPMEMATMELFQFMIGHTDWSALALHNVILIRNPAGEVTPVPFDFDFSGLVDAKYAGPPPGLPISRVTQRLYRGLCHPDIDWDALFAAFEEKKDDVFGLVDELPGLRSRSRNRVRRFIGGFYDTIESPKQRQDRIIDDCRDASAED